MRSWTPLAVLVLAASCTSSGPDASAVSLLEVVDGDTIRVALDGDVETVRLDGINAPEVGECFGKQAADFLEGLLAGGEIRLEQTPSDARDRFGRMLGFVTAGGERVNARMVASGHALALAGDNEEADELARLADGAWGARLGMWRPDACGPATQASVRISGLVSNPPGDDALVPNEETATIVNRTAGPVDLSGWVLRDESSSHRFVFGQVTLGPGEVVMVHSGCGADTAGDLYWCEGPVWSNIGDTALLLSPKGNVVDRVSYRDG